MLVSESALEGKEFVFDGLFLLGSSLCLIFVRQEELVIKKTI